MCKWREHMKKSKSFIAASIIVIIALAGCGTSSAPLQPNSQQTSLPAQNITGTDNNSESQSAPQTSNTNSTGGDHAKTGQAETGAGTTLQPVNITVTTPPSHLHMNDEQNGYGWSPDHPVMVTANGGATWTGVTPRIHGDNPVPIDTGYFVDVQNGWSFELQTEKSVTIYGTKDGGQTWSQLAIVPVKYGDGNISIAFADAWHGWFEDMTAGMGQLGGELFATDDGGKTWQRMAATDQNGSLPFGGQLTAQKDGTLWLSGGQRAAGSLGGPGFVWLYKSTDSGKTWSQVKLPLSAANEKETDSVSKPEFFGENGLVTVIFQNNAVLYASQDGGQTWSVRGTTPIKEGFFPVFEDAMFGWQITNDQVYFTKDGGRTWQPLHIDSTLQTALSGRFVGQVDFINSQQGWLLLFSRNGNSDNLLLRTNDGGQSWK